jgi:hypothetical protein
MFPFVVFFIGLAFRFANSSRGDLPEGLKIALHVVNSLFEEPIGIWTCHVVKLFIKLQHVKSCGTLSNTGD